MTAIKGAWMKWPVQIGLVFFCTCGWTQTADSIPSEEPGTEHLRIFTDRDIYMAGEDLYFRAFNLNQDSLQGSSWSKVFYAELISPDGFSHTRAKYSMDPGGAGGLLKIPSDIPSGNYFLKGYTRWMRNFGPGHYAYVSVEVINPFQRDLLPVDTASGFDVQLDRRGRIPEINGLLNSDPEGVYSRRARVHLDLALPPDHLPSHCCVTVVRKGVLDRQWESFPSPQENPLSGIAQLPETRGISLTGKVESKGKGSPVPYAVVYVSLMGKGSDFFANYSDSAGRFYFALPDRYGETDLYVSASHTGSRELELFIEQDFCTEPVTLASLPLEINETTEGLISEMSLNLQIMDQYSPRAGNAEDPGKDPVIFFYGAPSTVVRFDDFIKLPTMEEYFTEVTPKVSLRKSNGIRQLHVLGNHPDLAFYEPLVMIDGVAIFDVEAILAISPRYVDRLEIVESPYIRGNVTFGGIINIITRKGDLGFIELPSSGLLLNYSMYREPLPGDQIVQPTDPRIPDMRNTLYWDPDLELFPGTPQEISFRTSDAKGEYQIVLRGYDSSGTYFEGSIPFRVE